MYPHDTSARNTVPDGVYIYHVKQGEEDITLLAPALQTVGLSLRVCVCGHVCVCVCERVRVQKTHTHTGRR